MINLRRNLRRNLLGIIMASALLTSCQKEDAADIEVVSV